MQNNGDWSQSPTWPPPDAGYYPIPPQTSSQSRSTSNTSSHNPYSSFQNPYAESSRQPQHDPYQDPWVSAQDAYLSQQVPQALGFQFKNPVLTDPKPLSGTSPAPQPLLRPAPGFERLPAPPSFLVINLFTLRLAFKLIQGLDYYAERVEDLNWIAKFLEIYHPGYDLAKLTGERWRRYLAKYPDIVRRMKRQKSYPKIFMALHPGTPECREVIRKRGGMTDSKWSRDVFNTLGGSSY